MKQLDIFNDCFPSFDQLDKKGTIWKLFIDGAARKNPGFAGAGVYLLEDDNPVFKKGFFLEEKTNNQAEYLALLLGIFYASKHMASDDTLFIFSDSELLVKQLLGDYRVKNPDLKRLFDLAIELLQDLNYSICHVVREKNKVADQLANLGIDKRVKVPKEFLNLLASNDIYL